MAAGPERGQSFAKGGYVPSLGDIVHLNWSPIVGHEMAGPHYGLVISDTTFNHATGFCVVIPITSRTDKLSAFELPVALGRVRGAALVSALRSIDYMARDVRFEASGGAGVAKVANKRIGMFLPAA